MPAKKKAKKKSNPDITDWVIIKRSPIHRWGGFARKPIKKGVKVIEYVGEKIDKKESARRCEDQNQYIFELDDTWDLDGDVEWNPARYLNHGCAPNCEASNDGDRIWLLALRDIEKGEELTFNYGYSMDDYRDHPCECGAKTCLGYIVAEEHFSDVRKKEKRRRAAKKKGAKGA